MSNIQLQVNEPTGCVSGDQIPLNSDKCFNNLVENRSPQVYQQLDRQTGRLPRVGNQVEFVLPIVLMVLAITVRFVYYKLKNI